jgi:MSHA biogenesis protein MshP
MRRRPGPRSARGFLIIAAVFLLVVLAGLVAYLMTVSTTSQSASVADLNSARSYQASRAGLEVAAFQVLQSPGTCMASQNIAFTGNLAGYTATVTCESSGALTEGGGSVTAYKLVSNGCNEPVGPACPNSALVPTVVSTTTSAYYAERELSLTLTK